MTKEAKQKHATAELEQRAGSGIAKSADSEADKTRRDLRISKTKIRRCQRCEGPIRPPTIPLMVQRAGRIYSGHDQCFRSRTS